MLSDYFKLFFKGDAVAERSRSIPFVSPFLLLTILLSNSCQKSEELSGIYATCSDNIAVLKKDPLLFKQWSLDSSNHPIARKKSSANIVKSWKRNCLGQDVIIAVLDNGTEISHPEFEAKLILPGGTDFVDGDNDPTPDVDNSDPHGTAVAGKAAAADNGFGIVGVAPRAKILPIRIIYDYVEDSEIASAFYYADRHGADIINNSWGPQDNAGDIPISKVLDSAIKDLSKNGRDGKGMIFVWASGNGNESVSSDGYASHPDVLTVGASDDQGNKAWYSDYGSEVLTVSPSSGGLTSGIWSTDTKEGGYNLAPILTIGTYIVKVLAKQGSGSYSLELGDIQSGIPTIAETSNDFPENNAEQSITYPSIVSGRIDSLDDVDYYKFEVLSGELKVSLQVNEYQDLDLIISDENNVELFSSKGDVGEDENYFSGLYCNNFGGTSAAAPLLSGVIALLLSYDNDLTLPNIRWILKESASKDGLNDRLYPFENGFSEGFGYGRVNADMAFQYAVKPETLGNSDARQSQVISQKLNSEYYQANNRAKQNSTSPYYFSGNKKVPVIITGEEIIFKKTKLHHFTRNPISTVTTFQKSWAIKINNSNEKIYISSLVNIAINKELQNSTIRFHKLFDDYNIEKVKKISSSLYLVAPRETQSAENTLNLANRLSLDKRIIFAQPDFFRKYKLR